MLLAVNEKYRDIPFPICAAYDNDLGKFITGQEHLTDEEKKKEPFVIDPDEQYMIRNREIFYVHGPGEKRTKDDVMYEFLLKGGGHAVARAYKDCAKDVHLFYLQDMELEAAQQLNTEELIYEAMTKIRNDMPVSRWKDIGLFMGYDLKSFSQTIIEAKIKELCRTEPQKVLDFFKEEFQLELFFKKLLYYKILRKSGNVIRSSDGNVLVGDNQSAALLFLTSPKNSDLVDMWGLALKRYEDGDTADVIPEKKPIKGK